MSQERRFTAWFSVEERKYLNAEAKENGTSVNFILRSLVRKHYNLDRSAAKTPAVTGVTRNA